jgi:hypothetical protein
MAGAEDGELRLLHKEVGSHLYGERRESVNNAAFVMAGGFLSRICCGPVHRRPIFNMASIAGWVYGLD